MFWQLKQADTQCRPQRPPFTYGVRGPSLRAQEISFLKWIGVIQVTNQQHAVYVPFWVKAFCWAFIQINTVNTFLELLNQNILTAQEEKDDHRSGSTRETSIQPLTSTLLYSVLNEYAPVSLLQWWCWCLWCGWKGGTKNGRPSSSSSTQRTTCETISWSTTRRGEERKTR